MAVDKFGGRDQGEFRPTLPNFYSGPAFILRRTQQLLTSFYNAACKEAGLQLTEAQYSALCMIAACPSPPEQKMLAQYLGSDRSTISAVVDRLVRQGLVRRIVGRDRRTRALKVTAKAQSAIQLGHDCIKSADRQFFAHVDEAEREVIAAMLQTLSDNETTRASKFVALEADEADNLYQQMHFLVRRCVQVMIAGAPQDLSDVIVKSGMQFVVLYIVAACEPVDQATVSRILWIDRSSMSLMLRALENDGYITREADPKDKRRSLVKTTPAAMSILQPAVENGRQIDDNLFLGQAENLQSEFILHLGGMIKQLDDQREIS